MLKSHRGEGEIPMQGLAAGTNEDEVREGKQTRELSQDDNQRVFISEEQVVNSETSTTPQALEETNDKTAMPDALRTRGLIPSVIGAYRCTPQFCVNVSLSDDAKFATFHIERLLEETGWISLGIGYAMTMADLLIFWPNLTPENGGGPRGTVLSRKASHAYIEPHLVGSVHGTRSEDGSSEADLYLPVEYVLHNANLGANVATATKFIVQFTRLVRTKNLDDKLTRVKFKTFLLGLLSKIHLTDFVTDPGAHITQHSSVGTFEMDVAANNRI
jgi:hypothetical protein